MEGFANYVTDSASCDAFHTATANCTIQIFPLSGTEDSSPAVSKPRNSAAAACVLLLLYQRRICAVEMRAHILLDICNMLPLSLPICSIRFPAPSPMVSGTTSSDTNSNLPTPRSDSNSDHPRPRPVSKRMDRYACLISVLCIASPEMPTIMHASFPLPTISHILKVGGLFSTVGLIAFACLIPPSSTAYTGYSAYTGARLSSASNSSIF